MKITRIKQSLSRVNGKSSRGTGVKDREMLVHAYTSTTTNKDRLKRDTVIIKSRLMVEDDGLRDWRGRAIGWL